MDSRKRLKVTNPPARAGGLTDHAVATQVATLLKDPSFYPDEFKSWLPKYLNDNVNFNITAEQLPSVQGSQFVGMAGAPAFLNGWSNYGGANASAAYYLDPFNRVHLKGSVKGGGLNTTIFILPAGYRPQEAEIFPVVCNNAFGLVTIGPDGSVAMSGGGSNVYLTLSGISFRAV